MTEGGEVLYAHVTFSTIHDRLKFYLQTFGIGDTHYTLHAGCLVTLAMGGECAQENSFMSYIDLSGKHCMIFTQGQLNDDHSAAEQLYLSSSDNKTKNIFNNLVIF